MRLLLDTNVLLWWLSDDRKLGRSGRNIITDPGNEALVSAASVWEVAIKAALGRIEIDLNELEGAIVKSVFRPLPIALRDAAAVGRLPAVHRDPFDRMLAAQAIVEELRVVSRDRVFERYALSAKGLPPIMV